MSKGKLRASDIRAGMAARWSSPEWAIMWEVSNGTGARGGSRYADAVMMSLWPSRGLELHGVEIKVTRADWKREAANPEKAELIAAFCDRWYIHTPVGVVDDISDMPPAWGLREFDGKKWRTVREAEKTEAKPVDRTFLAALLRRADETTRADLRNAVDKARQAEAEETRRLRDRLNESIMKRVADEVDRRTRSFEHQAEFEEAFGQHDWGIDYAALGKAARAIHDARGSHFDLAALAKKLRAAADAVDEVQAIAGRATEDA